MLLGGLWHGASYNFVLWGGLHGMYLSLERAQRQAKFRLLPSRLPKLPKVLLSWLFVFCVIAFTRIFFRIEEFQVALSYVHGLWDYSEFLLRKISSKFEIAQVFVLISFTALIDGVFYRRRRLIKFLDSQWGPAFGIAFLILLVQLVGTFGGGAFIYFQF
jgi:alginate O-acetyltransferase complex protein AlgI